MPGILSDQLDAIMSGEYPPSAQARFDIDTADLYGGIAGFPLPLQRFEILPGLTLSRTYAHLIAPLLVAFSPPEKKGTPHPSPWASLNERVLTILVEVTLNAKAAPLSFNRLNTLWFVVALLRLRLMLPLQMPVLADRPFQRVPDDVMVANLFPVELNLSQRSIAARGKATEEDLIWLRENIVTADGLMRNPVFNRAVQTFDAAIALQHSGAGIVIAWASIEILIRPGSRQITERVCRALAAHLYTPGPGRDRAFAKIAACYQARGGAAHAGMIPEEEQFYSAFHLARAALLKTIEEGFLPNVDLLLERWRTRT